MKRNMIIKTLGTAVLLASVGITGCNIRVENDDDKKSDNEEEICCEADDEEDYSGGCYSSGDDDYSSSYSCCVPVADMDSTNGELPGQLDYMTLVPPCNSIDWDSYEISYISDLSVIANDDLRAVAEEYQAEGFSIIDPSQDQEYGLAKGDGEYMFTNGFSGEHLTDDASEFIYAYEMNEDLFEYFLVAPYSYEGVECSDDGSVIRYTAEGYVAEYNRDTGIGFLYTGCFF